MEVEKNPKQFRRENAAKIEQFSVKKIFVYFVLSHPTFNKKM